MNFFDELKEEDENVVIFEITKPESGRTACITHRSDEIAEEVKFHFECVSNIIRLAMLNINQTPCMLVFQPDLFEWEFVFLSHALMAVTASFSGKVDY